MSASPVYTISRLKQWQYLLKMWLPGALLGLFAVGIVIYLFCIIPNSEIADVQGAVSRHSAGVVSSVTYLLVTKGNTNPPILASVLINGDMATFRTHAPLSKNERVQVIYRVGKSGRTHIDDIEPDREAKP